jgi:hypothetical protein
LWQTIYSEKPKVFAMCTFYRQSLLNSGLEHFNSMQMIQRPAKGFSVKVIQSDNWLALG